MKQRNTFLAIVALSALLAQPSHASQLGGDEAQVDLSYRTHDLSGKLLAFFDLRTSAEAELAGTLLIRVNGRALEPRPVQGSGLITVVVGVGDPQEVRTLHAEFVGLVDLEGKEFPVFERIYGLVSRVGSLDASARTVFPTLSPLPPPRRSGGHF